MNSITLHDAITLIDQLSAEDQRALLSQLQERLLPPSSKDWALEGAQLAFMIQHHDAIEAAYESDDIDFLDSLESSAEYRALFGDMPWDEAYDRYEETWWNDDEDST